jgi:hypothetical protein
MPTQVIQLELSGARDPVPVRADVGGLFVVVTGDGRPIDIQRLPRPVSGVLSPSDIALDRVRGASSRDRAPSKGSTPLTVIVPTRERPDDLTTCLAALAPLRAAGHEVIVVDNGPSTTRTRDVAAAHGVRLVTEPEPGLNRARNAGVAHARHDIVAFVDDDAVIGTGWADAIAEPFGDAAVGCVTGLVLPLELETEAQEQFEIYCQHRRDLRPRVYSSRTLRPSAAGVVGMGANMAFRRQLLRDRGCSMRAMPSRTRPTRTSGIVTGGRCAMCGGACSGTVWASTAG